MESNATNVKIETLIQRTVEECEKEGFSIFEALKFSSDLRIKIENLARQCKKVCKFKDYQNFQ